jgi:hypothetical protein
MKHFLPFLLSSLPVISLAQAPVITSVVPLVNANAAPRTSSLIVTFSQPLIAASVNALQVFSSQRGGRRTRATPALVSGNTLSFIPSGYAFWPGETVQYTVSPTAASAGGVLARSRVGQFTTHVGGTGSGNFLPGSDPLVGNSPISLVVGDVDNDGDLDVIAANYGGSTASVRLNAGNGTFSAGQEISVGSLPESIAMGDIDGDGDLDLIVSNGSFSGPALNVRFNSGSGFFSNGQSIPSNTYYKVVLGDVDGDGDLDILALDGSTNAVSVYLNINVSSGTFTPSSQGSVSVGNGAFDLAISDIDNDGDLDLLTANDNINTVSVRLNNGSGTFSGGQEVAVGINPARLVTGDLDGDGDVDFITVNQGNNTVGVRLNNGSGSFSNGQTLVFSGITSLAASDVDNDGDLDLLLTNVTMTTNPYYSIVNVRLNNGSGTFSGGQDLQVGPSPCGLVTADVDGDGDLDLLTANQANATISVRLNGGTALAVTPSQAHAGLVLFPNPTHRTATLTGASPYVVFTVFDALGRVVLHTSTDATGSAYLTLPNNLPAGLYFVQGGQQAGRLLVE